MGLVDRGPLGIICPCVGLWRIRRLRVIRRREKPWAVLTMHFCRHGSTVLVGERGTAFAVAESCRRHYLSAVHFLPFALLFLAGVTAARAPLNRLPLPMQESERAPSQSEWSEGVYVVHRWRVVIMITQSDEGKRFTNAKAVSQYKRGVRTWPLFPFCSSLCCLAMSFYEYSDGKWCRKVFGRTRQIAFQKVRTLNLWGRVRTLLNPGLVRTGSGHQSECTYIHVHIYMCNQTHFSEVIQQGDHISHIRVQASVGLRAQVPRKPAVLHLTEILAIPPNVKHTSYCQAVEKSMWCMTLWVVDVRAEKYRMHFRYFLFCLS